ncbi:MAG: hypothetical protein ACXAC5_04380 [Promethearchaeota archaeon]|jgi:hypothetical protein
MIKIGQHYQAPDDCECYECGCQIFEVVAIRGDEAKLKCCGCDFFDYFDTEEMFKFDEKYRLVT